MFARKKVGANSDPNEPCTPAAAPEALVAASPEAGAGGEGPPPPVRACHADEGSDVIDDQSDPSEEAAAVDADVSTEGADVAGGELAVAVWSGHGLVCIACGSTCGSWCVRSHGIAGGGGGGGNGTGGAAVRRRRCSSQ